MTGLDLASDDTVPLVATDGRPRDGVLRSDGGSADPLESQRYLDYLPQRSISCDESIHVLERRSSFALVDQGEDELDVLLVVFELIELGPATLVQGFDYATEPCRHHVELSDGQPIDIREDVLLEPTVGG